MTKTIFPQTTLLPLQDLIFILKENNPVRARLTMQPDYSRESVDHVELDIIFPNVPIPVPFNIPGKTRGIQQAAQYAFTIAQKSANDLQTTISEVWLEGEEFLELKDLTNIVGSSIAVKLI